MTQNYKTCKILRCLSSNTPINNKRALEYIKNDELDIQNVYNGKTIFEYLLEFKQFRKEIIIEIMKKECFLNICNKQNFINFVNKLYANKLFDDLLVLLSYKNESNILSYYNPFIICIHNMYDEFKEKNNELLHNIALNVHTICTNNPTLRETLEYKDIVEMFDIFPSNTEIVNMKIIIENKPENYKGNKKCALIGGIIKQLCEIADYNILCEFIESRKEEFSTVAEYYMSIYTILFYLAKENMFEVKEKICEKYPKECEPLIFGTPAFIKCYDDDKSTYIKNVMNWVNEQR